MADKQKNHGKNARKGRRSAKHKASGYYTQRFQITERNRRRKRLKHLSLHPNDRQTLAKMRVEMTSQSGS